MLNSCRRGLVFVIMLLVLPSSNGGFISSDEVRVRRLAPAWGDGDADGEFAGATHDR